MSGVTNYRLCANALLMMWMDNVLTDGEYGHIMDKLNAYAIKEGLIKDAKMDGERKDDGKNREDDL